MPWNCSPKTSLRSGCAASSGARSGLSCSNWGSPISHRHCRSRRANGQRCAWSRMFLVTEIRWAASSFRRRGNLYPARRRSFCRVGLASPPRLEQHSRSHGASIRGRCTEPDKCRDRPRDGRRPPSRLRPQRTGGTSLAPVFSYDNASSRRCPDVVLFDHPRRWRRVYPGQWRLRPRRPRSRCRQ